MTDDDIRKRRYETQAETIDADMAPFGFIDDGIHYGELASFTDDKGDYWIPTKAPDAFDVY